MLGLETKIGLAPKQPKNCLLGELDRLNEQHILVRREGGLGDLVFAASILAGIKSRCPSARTILGCSERWIGLAQRFACADETVVATASRQAEFLQRLDYLIDLRGVIEGNREALDRDYYELHYERAGLDPKRIVLAKMSSRCPDWLAPRSYVAIHVGGSSPNKHMTVKQYKLLFTWLNAQRIPYQVVGDRYDGDRLYELAERTPRLGDLSIEQCADVVLNCAVFLGPDSGFLHLAGSNGVPTISWWGPFNHRLTVPNYQDAVAIQSSQSCSPCGVIQHRLCENNAKCTRTIDVGSVIKLAARIVPQKLRRAKVEVAERGPKAAPSRVYSMPTRTYREAEPMFTQRPRVSVVIPVYRTSRFLPGLFDSLKASNYRAFETITVSDGDGPLDVPGKQLMLVPNQGYSAANNVATRYMADESEYVCLLNSDTQVTPNWLGPLVKVLDDDPKCGIVAGVHLSQNGRVNSYGSSWSWKSGSFPHNEMGRHNLIGLAPRLVDMATFACVLIRRDLWTRLGGLDEGYIRAYYEDSDFCMRVRELGYSIRCVPNSVITHFGGQSGAIHSVPLGENRNRFHKRWVHNGLVDKFARERGEAVHDGPVVACYIVLNEAEYIQGSLESIYEFADRIVVVEGGNDFAVSAGWCGPDKRSTDGTIELVQNFPDPKGKIKLITGSWTNKSEQRNAYVAELREGDWMLLMDGDELFDERGLWRLSALMHQHDVLCPGFYLFWNNCSTLGIGAWTKYQQMKVVKWHTGYHFGTDHNMPITAEGRRVVDLGNVYRGEEPLYYHYSWVKPLEKLRQKARYYKHQIGDVSVDYVDDVLLKWRADPQSVLETHPRGGGGLWRPFTGSHPKWIAKQIELGLIGGPTW